MLKYIEYAVTFSEIPDEITCCINISGCPNRCPDCHSKYLWEDKGNDLDLKALYEIIEPIKSGITCVVFMGGDSDPSYINYLSLITKMAFPGLRVGWYSGKQELSDKIDIDRFDYIKLGPYIKEKGPLNEKTTNQRLYRVFNNQLRDITSRFWEVPTSIE